MLCLRSVANNFTDWRPKGEEDGNMFQDVFVNLVQNYMFMTMFEELESQQSCRLFGKRFLSNFLGKFKLFSKSYLGKKVIKKTKKDFRWKTTIMF